jgi:hypothetical protein
MGACEGMPADEPTGPTPGSQTSPTASAQTEPSQALSPTKEMIEAKAKGLAIDVPLAFWTPLTANNPTVAVGGSIQLSVSANADVGPTVYYIEIFDVDTGAQVARCGFGTTCTATVSQSIATLHRYQAFISGYGMTLPPPYIQDASNVAYLTWSPDGYSVSLPASVSCYSGTGQVTATATANVDVGPTPLYIQIFDTIGNRLAICGYGKTCTATYGCGLANLVAFVSSSDANLPPFNTHASSNISVVRVVPR